jgi:hypothetical protein
MRLALTIYILPFLTATWLPSEIIRQDNKRQGEKKVKTSERVDW